MSQTIVPPTIISVYTDGSSNPAYNLGGWACIIFIEGKKIILKGLEKDVTHQQMELCAVINSLHYLKNQIGLQNTTLIIYTDSQYVVGLQDRKEKLKTARFLTNRGTPIRNQEYVMRLTRDMDSCPVEFRKVKAHQKNDGTANYNREVDILIRREIREAVALAALGLVNK